MPQRPINRMPLELRAKQFAPFRALVGLEEALELMEDTPVPRPTLGEESAEELNHDLQMLVSRLKTEDEIPIQIQWYEAGHIRKGSDRLRKIDRYHRYLYPTEHAPIYFDDLLFVHPL